jgi:hypothetical protein
MSGNFKDISVFPDPLKSETRSIVSKVVNGALTAILGLLPPMDAGVGQNNANCQELVDAARKHGAPVPPAGGKAPAAPSGSKTPNPAAKTPAAEPKSR